MFFSSKMNKTKNENIKFIFTLMKCTCGTSAH